MTVDQAYTFLQFIARKNRTGSISPKEFEMAVNTGQRNYFDFLIGQVEQYRYGKSLPRVGLGDNSRIANMLSPFKYGPTTISVASGTGIATYPAGFHTTASISTTGGKVVERIDDARLASRLNSKIDPITSDNPLYVESKTGWVIYPFSLGNISVNYYKAPADVVWSHTDGVYKSEGSVHPEWRDSEMDEVLARAAKILGFSFEKQSLVQFGNEVKTNGE